MTSVHGIRVAGGTLPATIWRLFMTEALRGVPPRPFAVPRSDVVIVEIDPVTGLLAASWCPGERKKMLRQLAPTEYCPQPAVVPTIGGTPGPTPTEDGRKKKEPATPEPEPSKEKSPEPTPSE